MKRSCSLQCSGHCTVPNEWITLVRGGINRIYYIDGGVGGYIEEGKRIPFEIGKLYFIPSYACIPTYTDEKDRLSHAFVNFYLTPPIVSKNVFCIDPHKDVQTEAALNAFISFCTPPFNSKKLRTPLNGEEELQAAMLESLTVYLMERSIYGKTESVVTDDTVITALNLIHSTLAEKLTVSDVAARCYMSTDGFIRKFTRIIGETPYSYIKRLKIRTALMMRAEGATAEEAATACGYSDAVALRHAISAQKI